MTTATTASGIYRGYNYGGHHYYGYYPGLLVPPRLLRVGLRPGAAPVTGELVGGWGWGGSPWYGFYGGYFAPYPVYAVAAFWLTDYVIAANCRRPMQPVGSRRRLTAGYDRQLQTTETEVSGQAAIRARLL